MKFNWFRKKGTQIPNTYFNQQSAFLGDGIVFYPSDNGQKYIDKGYKLNDSIYSIVSKNAGKCGQVRLYHTKIKKDEKKTLMEYQLLQKGSINDKVIKELSKMRKAMTEDLEVKSDLAKLLNKPNRNQTQSEWVENLVGLRELQGEGNIWMPKLDKKPLELFVIPKPHLQVVGNNSNPWEIMAYIFNLAGKEIRWEKEDLIMWKYANPSMIDLTFEHLRGMAPLKAFDVQMQAMNEADKRMANMNNNAGASGLLYRKDVKEVPTDKGIADGIRHQIDNTLNSNEVAGKIAWLAGEWDYIQFGHSLADLKIIEQYGLGFKRLCRVFNTPTGIFSENTDTYENVKQYKRDWIYDKIAPMMYQLRGILSDDLVPAFGLDPERDIIDMDIMSLPELSMDLKERVEAIKDVWQLTPNQVLDYLGYEASTDPNMEKVYIPSTMTPLDQLNEDMGKSLDNEIRQLGEGA